MDPCSSANQVFLQKTSLISADDEDSKFLYFLAYKLHLANNKFSEAKEMLGQLSAIMKEQEGSL